MDISSLLTLLVFAASIVGSAAYIQLRNKAIPVIKECADTGNAVWNFLKDMTDGNGCDMSQAGPLLKRVEKCWVDIAALAPFVREILASVPKRG